MPGLRTRFSIPIVAVLLSALSLATGSVFAGDALPVAPAQLEASYWIAKLPDAERVVLDADAIAARAARRDVEVTTIGRYRMRAAAAGARDGLLLGFAAVDAAELRRGVRELARAVEG